MLTLACAFTARLVRLVVPPLAAMMEIPPALLLAPLLQPAIPDTTPPIARSKSVTRKVLTAVAERWLRNLGRMS
jgi:hypothetical protein